MDRSTPTFEQLQLPDTNPTNETLREAGLTEAQDARIDRLMDQAGKNYEDARAIVLGGENAVTHTATLEPVEPEVTAKTSPKPVTSRRRRSAKDQAWGETTPAEDGWSDVA